MTDSGLAKNHAGLCALALVVAAIVVLLVATIGTFVSTAEYDRVTSPAVGVSG